MRPRHLILCVAALSLVATSSSAATIIETVTPIPLTYTYSGGACPFEHSGELLCASEYEARFYGGDTNTLTMSGFDPALGTLESVELVVSAQGMIVTSHSAPAGTPSDPGTASIRFGVSIALVDESGYDTLPGTSAGVFVRETRQICTPSPCYLSWDIDGTTSAVITEDLSRFVGPIVLATEGEHSVYGSAYTQRASRLSSEVTQLDVIYTYTAPEPGTGLLMALGLAMAARPRKRI